MKDDLEDLLKQIYAQKEEPSQEFCHTVIQKMKRGNQKGFFRTEEKGYYKGILMAVICAGILILAGIGVQVYRQGDLQDKKVPWKQGIAEHERQKSDTAENPLGKENGVETGDLTDGEKQSEAKTELDDKKQLKTGNPSDGKNKVETTSTSDQAPERTTGRAGESDAGQAGSNSSAGLESRNSQIMETKKPMETSKPSEILKPARTSKPVETSKPARTSKPVETSKPAKTSKPTETSKPVRTSKPTETSKPILPSETEQPQETTDPQGNYIAVCSIESYTFSTTPLSPTATSTEPPTDSPTGEVANTPDSVFDGGSWLVLSYEQLQALIGELEAKLVQNPNHGLQNTLQHLKEYEQSYFVSDALCVNLSLMDAGFAMNLQAVWMRDGGQGDYYLEINLGKSCDKAEQAVEMKYYASFVSVPQEIARRCNMVLFRFSEKEVEEMRCEL